MENNFKILIADRNPHVREFLRREMSAAGYQVELAKTIQGVLTLVFKDESLNLLILDTDLLETDRTAILQKLQNRLPYLPMIFYTFSFDEMIDTEKLTAAAVVEKSGSSVEELKKAALKLLSRHRD